MDTLYICKLYIAGTWGICQMHAPPVYNSKVKIYTTYICTRHNSDPKIYTGLNMHQDTYENPRYQILCQAYI